MGEAYLPAGWPEAVAPPGSQDWEASAVAWLLDLVPDLRGHSAVRRHPVILAVIARHTVTSPSVSSEKSHKRPEDWVGRW
jgi:hypothetical protein